VTQLFVVNVGVNRTHAQRGLRSPIFADGTFEFVPIPEIAPFDTSSLVPTYDSLPGWTGRTVRLSDYVPPHLWSARAHADPEFATYTYGDDASDARAANLRNAKSGDQLWFLARVWRYDEHERKWIDRRGVFSFIGYFRVDRNEVIPAGTGLGQLEPTLAERISRNAHYRWVEAGGASWPSRVITGQRDGSRRFRTALQVTPEVAGLIYGGTRAPDADEYRSDGNVLRNKQGNARTFANFGSETRTIQGWLSSERDGDEEYVRILMERADACGKAEPPSGVA
jgi:hypothetical protein